MDAKKIILTITIVVGVIFIINRIATVSDMTGGKAKGENVKISATTPARVTFYSKCPECKHVEDLEGVNISKGEDFESFVVCSECGEMYDISIRR